MRRLIIAYAATLIVLVAIDSLWLSLMATKLYRPVLGDMLAPNFRLVPASTFYLVYAGGLTHLAVRPAIRSRTVAKAARSGAILGFTAYATYDLTNQATLKNWSTMLTISDLLWGIVLSSMAAAAATRVFLWIAPACVDDGDKP